VRFRSQLGDYLNSHGLTGVGVELGVSTGLFSEQLLRHWLGRTLCLIDPWRHLSDYLDSFNASDKIMARRLEIARRRLEPWQERLRWFLETSEVAAKRFARGSCDFVYIDANHSYQHVCRDLQLWYPKVRPGGLFAGHDYFDATADAKLEPNISEHIPKKMLTSYGVKSAVDEFAKNIGVVIGQTAEKYPTWYFHKPSTRPEKGRELK
jgi:hypothetical protein